MTCHPHAFGQLLRASVSVGAQARCALRICGWLKGVVCKLSIDGFHPGKHFPQSAQDQDEDGEDDDDDGAEIDIGIEDLQEDWDAPDCVDI